MSQELTRFIGDKSGPELVKWAVITLIILIATSVVVISLRDAVMEGMDSILCN
jgi:hypothetical protein